MTSAQVTHLRRWLWLALFGIATVVVGFGWDALSHAADPGLAAREGPLSPANPSHLLVGAGLVVVAGAVGAAASSAGALGRRRGVRVLAAVALVGFAAVTAGYAIRAGGVEHPHDRIEAGDHGAPGEWSVFMPPGH